MSNAIQTTEKKDQTITFQAFGSGEEVKLSVAIIRRFIAKPTRSGAEATEADCMKFMMLCRARSLNPFEGDAYMVGYDSQSNGPEFSIITAYQAFTKRAEASEDYDGLESGVIVKASNGEIVERQGDFFLDDDTLLGGWAKVYRKNISRPFVSRLKLQTRKKSTTVWGSDPGGMIVKCAEADAMRQAFPTKLGGMFLEYEKAPDTRDVTPAASTSRLLKDPTPIETQAPTLEILLASSGLTMEQVREVTDANDMTQSGFPLNDDQEAEIVKNWKEIVKLIEGDGK